MSIHQFPKKDGVHRRASSKYGAHFVFTMLLLATAFYTVRWPLVALVIACLAIKAS